jgi:hypothetical protein
MRFIRMLTLIGLVLASTHDAFADATLFIGNTTTPTSRLAKGVAVGFGLVIVGFEFEYSDTSEDEGEGAPSLRTGMGNGYLQTPGAIVGIRPYFTTGVGVYRERLGTFQETHYGFNTGFGAKISLLGPLRARVDYRTFKLRGDPLHSTVHRFYVGANIAF